MKTKQVIVWRNDLKVRSGKIAAQVAHASMSFLTRGMTFVKVLGYKETFLTSFKREEEFCEEIESWLAHSFKKVVVYVDSEEELLALHEHAKSKGLESHLITDNGATEFNGVPTNTCIAIGPHADEKFFSVTDHLPLL